MDIAFIIGEAVLSAACSAPAPVAIGDGGNSVSDRAQVKQGDQGSARLLRGPPSVYRTYIHVTYVTNIYVCCMSKAVYHKVSLLYLEGEMALKPLL